MRAKLFLSWLGTAAFGVLAGATLVAAYETLAITIDLWKQRPDANYEIQYFLGGSTATVEAAFVFGAFFAVPISIVSAPIWIVLWRLGLDRLSAALSLGFC